MAAADYYNCDSCGKRAFCDADCSYTKDRLDAENSKPLLCGVGQMRVLCEECAKIKKVIIVDVCSN